MSKFAAYVTSTAFHLSLSKPMILNLEFIQWCTNHPDEYGGYPSSLDRWGNASTVNALIERGLIERIQTDAKSHVQTTQAGQMVLRVHFLAWLARALLRTDDLLIRKEASHAILQLIGGKHE